MKTIIEMAREAGMVVIDDEYSLLPFLKRFEALVRADEREECAKHCEGINSLEDYYGDRPELACAESIRARGQSQVCCEEYNTCVRPCTPRGRHHGQEAEREACAKVCEEVAVDSYTKIGMAHEPYMKATAEDCARHIRARGNT
jgi:hypothetical protein